MVNYDKVPNERMKSDVRRHVETGTVHSDFLYAVLTNDLVDSFALADLENRKKLNDWRIFIYNELPANCWGSEEKVDNWDGLNS